MGWEIFGTIEGGGGEEEVMDKAFRLIFYEDGGGIFKVFIEPISINKGVNGNERNAKKPAQRLS